MNDLIFLSEGDENSYSFFLITQEIASHFQLSNCWNHKAEWTATTEQQEISGYFHFGLLTLETPEGFDFHRAAAQYFEDLKTI